MGALGDRNDDDHHVVVNETWEFDNHVSLESCELRWISFHPLLEKIDLASYDAPTELMGAS